MNRPRTGSEPNGRWSAAISELRADAGRPPHRFVADVRSRDVSAAEIKHRPASGTGGGRPTKVDGAHQIVGQGIPEHDRPDFREPADVKLLQATIAGDGVDALGGGRSSAVDRF